MAGIFISYRRVDTARNAGQLYDQISDYFGREQVFMDIDAIKPGEDFVKVLEKTVGSCEVLLVLIGTQWLTCTDPKGKRCLDNLDDFVRLEILWGINREMRLI